MTSLDLERRGLWIDRSGPWPQAMGPSRDEDPDFGDDLRYEIELRRGLVGSGAVFKTVHPTPMPESRRPIRSLEFNFCAHCKNKWHTYGTCCLCELARGKNLREVWETEQRVAKALNHDDLPY